ncbi:hypothetical protein GCM10009682_46090 [Luedemannella flava]|uniref:GerMN domain-containing protein n=1 Tax=Luedemannella flava TaxID=349316 RepID=A0ABP4YLF8_9ACTN
MTRTRRYLAAVAAGLVVVALAGCGVTATDEPRRIDDGLDVAALPDTSTYVPPPGPDEVRDRDPVGFVMAYLNAAAGTDNQAIDRVRRFVDSAESDAWQPAKGDARKVVRVVGTPTRESVREGVTQVKVTVEAVGLLDSAGELGAPQIGAKEVLTFEVTRVGNQSPRLSKAPSDLLLLDRALHDHYEALPVYYWDKSDKVLVPDLRYFSRAENRERRTTTAVEYLLAGPSLGLQQVVRGIPDGAKLNNLVVPQDSGVMVDIADAAYTDEQEAQKLVTQLRWTLRGVTGEETSLALRVEGSPRQIDGTSDAYLKANGSYQQPNQRFTIGSAAKGKVVADGAKLPVLSDPQVNRDVVTAAVNRDFSLGAFVRRDAGGLSLWVVRANNTTGSTTRVRVNVGDATAISRPAWLYQTDSALVAVDGVLHAVKSDGQLRQLSAGGATGVTQVAAAPDGRRVALIASGKVYVASVTADGSIVSVRQVKTSFTATGVVWSSQTQILVMGTMPNRVVAWIFNADGADGIEGTATTDQGPKIDALQALALQGMTDLTAVPTTPEDKGVVNAVYARVGDKVYNYYPRSSGLVSPIEGETLVFYPN